MGRVQVAHREERLSFLARAGALGTLAHLLSAGVTMAGGAVSVIQPVYVIELSVSGCNYDVRMNDCPIASEDEDAPVHGEYPLNTWLRPGPNELSAVLSPVSGSDEVGPGASVSATILVADYAHPDRPAEPVLRLVYPEPPKQGTKGPGETAGAGPQPRTMESTKRGATIDLKARFEADVPFGPPVWVRSRSVADPESVKPELVRQLKAFWRMLSEKRMEDVVAWLEPRDREMAERLYQPATAVQARTKASFTMAVEDQNLPLQPFRDDDLAIVAYGYGRLLRVNLRRIGQSPVFFADSGFDLVSHVNVLFCQIDGKGWVPIR